jgi:hypothetical protein
VPFVFTFFMVPIRITNLKPPLARRNRKALMRQQLLRPFPGPSARARTVLRRLKISLLPPRLSMDPSPPLLPLPRTQSPLKKSPKRRPLRMLRERSLQPRRHPARLRWARSGPKSNTVGAQQALARLRGLQPISTTMATLGITPLTDRDPRSCLAPHLAWRTWCTLVPGIRLISPTFLAFPTRWVKCQTG